MLKNFFRKLKRGLNWFLFMYNNEEWDFMYFYQFLEKRLEDLKRYYQTDSIDLYVGTKIVNKIEQILYYLKLVQKDDFFERPEFKEFHEKYGELVMELEPSLDGKTSLCKFNFKKCETPEEYAKASQEYTILSTKFEKLRKDYKEKFFGLLSKYIETFWD